MCTPRWYALAFMRSADAADAEVDRRRRRRRLLFSYYKLYQRRKEGFKGVRLFLQIGGMNICI